MALHPLFADILRRHLSEPGIPPSPTPAPRREPTEAGGPDTRTTEEVCEDILKLAQRMKENP